VTPVMTVGALSRRTGVPVKTLRTYEDMGLIYTVGRSAGNYRLFGPEALWCVGVVEGLRRVGLTLAEISDLASSYLRDAGEPLGPRLAGLLQDVRARTGEHIAELQGRLDRIAEFETVWAAELAGQADFRAHDPTSGQAGLDPPTGGRP
jgi:MerR family transcriptional regulator, copper efflux regulator